MLPFLIGAGILGAKALGGVGIGYGASRMSDNGYSSTDALIDGGLGALTLPGLGAGRNAYRAGRVAVAGRSMLNPTRAMFGGLDRNLASRLMLKAGGASLIPFTVRGGDDNGDNDFTPDERAARWDSAAIAHNIQKGKPGASVALGLPTVSPVQIAYVPGAAPSFNKTLKDYLADKQLQGLVNQQIFATNKPLLDANKAEATKKQRKLKQNAQLGAGLQQQYIKRIEDQAADIAAQQARADVRQQVLNAETAQAQAQVPLTYQDGEMAVATSQAKDAMANEQALADSLVDRLAGESKAYLEALRNAEAQQTRVDAKGIEQAATDAIKSNVSQVRANQAQRGSLLGTLAAEQYKNAIDLHNLAIQNYNNTEDRKYQQAASQAEIDYNANAANAELEEAAVEAALEGSTASGSKGNKDQAKRGSSRLLSLQKSLDEARTKMVKDPKTGEQVLWAGTQEGKKQIKALRHRIAEVKKRYGL